MQKKVFIVYVNGEKEEEAGESTAAYSIFYIYRPGGQRGEGERTRMAGNSL